MYKNDYASTSMPNIDANFGQSLAHSNAALLKPSTSAANLVSSHEEPCSSQSKPQESQQENANTDKTEGAGGNVGLYEELLASSASYGDWNSPVLDETALLAQALALSQQEFLDSLEKKKPNQ
ncbi:unnamed protein product [Bursaphelenchus okinawaensis]|uniref:Uncharacterized protein n=1 Tax=Bursaphelenchus okinawaensis TaxID=465554 RepID=A0A811L351_9BILA|nr:unnamed protein product [Bursaphelenchus okinawaensis]CAG9115489.1 unnamed protein product [Bursaphelenchus okinawaensis]